MSLRSPVTTLLPTDAVPSSNRRTVGIANNLSLLFAMVAIGVVLIFYYVFGWFNALWLIILIVFLFLSVIPINRFWNHDVGRMLFCLTPVWVTFLASILFKLANEPRSYVFYFDSRFILLTTAILPGIVYRLRERAALAICLGSTFFCLLFYDPIHEFFGAGYYQRGFTDPSYYYINYIAVITFFTILFGVWLMRSVLEQSEGRLQARNDELLEKQVEIETQNERLAWQQEEMMQVNAGMAEANRVISKQRSELEKYNMHLEDLVREKSQEVINSNNELVMHNHELLQFSHSVSHNLRAPVARLLGLTHLLNFSQSPKEKEDVEQLIIKSSWEVEQVLTDLRRAIDLSNEVYKVSDEVFLQGACESALRLLGETLMSDHRIEMDFTKAPRIVGITPMIESVFYNLLSNAIKFQSPSRRLHVQIRSARGPGGKTIIEIKDNGLGFDVNAEKDNLFKLYKRFHNHVPGKGLGLYLVRSQVDTMGGSINVQSEVDVGTTFRLTLKGSNGTG